MNVVLETFSDANRTCKIYVSINNIFLTGNNGKVMILLSLVSTQWCYHWIVFISRVFVKMYLSIKSQEYLNFDFELYWRLRERKNNM